ncbi:DMT family transporter [Paroceanicella profunda]|uniref:DMT family transporter n=1 Tax=Paroceanicella profunda TaxID=2579971 RepID=A0A5B8FVV7_9RHOB|nr:DMT family transporter [Paroceanicella profunda]QDL90629.1 DMT family transporter [Paroceanicella profunda]
MKNGIWFILAAMSLTPALDGVAKEMSLTYAPIFICFTRYLSAGLVSLAAARLRGERLRVERAGLGGQLLSAALMMGAMTSFIMALSMVPMAEAVGGFLIAPIVSTALSVIFLGERLTRTRVIGSLLSILGAVIIMDPGMGLEQGTLLALAGGAMLGGFYTVSRAHRAASGTFAPLALQSLMGAAMIAPLALAEGVPAIDATYLCWAALLGVLSAMCHLLTILAFRLSEATVLAPFTYFNVIAAVAVGIVFFGEIPGEATLSGLVALVAGGLITAAGPGQVSALLARLDVLRPTPVSVRVRVPVSVPAR